jgi:hypothetical protein
MRQAIYCSRALRAGEEHLADILDRSRINNPELGITGVLIVIGDTYLQLLEGPEESVGTLLEFIAEDDRHDRMEVLARRPMTAREFGDWAMAHHDVEPDSALDAQVLEAIEAARRERCAETCDRLMDLVADIGRAVKRRGRAPSEPQPGPGMSAVA